MPGANLSVGIAPNPDRGLRSPREVGYVYGQAPQVLQPFMVHPLRPGETLAGLSVRGDSFIPSIVNLPQAPMTWAELGIWIVPLSTLDPFFTDLVVGTGEDVAERATALKVGGTAAGLAPNPLSDQGHLTPGLQGSLRAWAGEIGGSSGGNLILGSQYAPYTSHSTYKVAADWYDIRTTLDYQSVGLFDNPPGIEKFVRGALANNFDAGLVGVDPGPVTGFDLSTLIEQMFLLTQGEYTYAEYLAAHSVNPRMAGGLSQPVLVEQAFMNPQRDGQFVGGTIAATAQNNFEENTFDSSWVGDQIDPTSESTYVHDRAPYGMLRSHWNINKTRGVFIEEPSVLLGTLTHWPVTAADNEYSYHFDMNRMTHPGHWGNRTGGGFDEEDFIATQLIYQKDQVNLQAGSEGDQSGDAVFNLMNKYLHGEINAIGDGAPDAFRFKKPGGESYNQANTDMLSKISTQLHILSDMVA